MINIPDVFKIFPDIDPVHPGATFTETGNLDEWEITTQGHSFNDSPNAVIERLMIRKRDNKFTQLVQGLMGANFGEMGWRNDRAMAVAKLDLSGRIKVNEYQLGIQGTSLQEIAQILGLEMLTEDAHQLARYIADIILKSGQFMLRDGQYKDVYFRDDGDLATQNLGGAVLMEFGQHKVSRNNRWFNEKEVRDGKILSKPSPGSIRALPVLWEEQKAVPFYVDVDRNNNRVHIVLRKIGTSTDHARIGGYQLHPNQENGLVEQVVSKLWKPIKALAQRAFLPSDEAPAYFSIDTEIGPGDHYKRTLDLSEISVRGEEDIVQSTIGHRREITARSSEVRSHNVGIAKNRVLKINKL